MPPRTVLGPRVRAALVLLAVFSLGLFTGHLLERHRGSPARVSAAAEHAAALAELRDVASLDDEQIERIHAILAERQELVQSLWEQLRPEVQSAMQEVHAEIAELLRPDQRQHFYDWLRQHGAAGGPHHP